MKYSFQQFEFDCNKRILTKNGEELPLHEKASQLLALFLMEADKIHSKSEILEHIWSGKVVTDQVIFQNISHLRALFGNDAIKTFIKKGYQWRLPIVEVVEQETSVPTQADSAETGNNSNVDEPPPFASTTTKSATASYNKKKWSAKHGLATLFFITFALVLAFTGVINDWFSEEKRQSPTSRTLVTLSPGAQKSLLQTALTSHDKVATLFSLQDSKALSSQQLFDSPFSAWRQLSHTEKDWAVATRTYQFFEGEILRFHIQGKYRGWQGYIHAEPVKATQQLSDLLVLLDDTAYFSLKSDSAALSELILLQNRQPDNFLINHQLISMHFQLGHFDLATALVDRQLAQASEPIFLGLLHLLKAKSRMENENWQGAEQNMNLAIEIFRQLKLPQLESLVLLEFAWINYMNGDPHAIMRTLNLAASKAREANEPLQELQARLLQAYLASKTKQTELMRAQLDLAKNLLDFYDLEPQHEIPIFSTLAWSEADKQNALPHYMAILNQPFAPLYKDRFYNAAMHVRNINIKAKQWQSALDSIRDWQRPSFTSLTKAHVAFAQNNWQAGVEQGLNAFRQAQVDYQLQDALDAALLLLQNETAQKNLPNAEEFSDYIKQNATHSWLDQNKTQLAGLVEP